MPVNKNAPAQEKSVSNRELAASSFRKTMRKAPGTRMGTWEDWREGSSASRKISDPHGHAIRDGR